MVGQAWIGNVAARKGNGKRTGTTDGDIRLDHVGELSVRQRLCRHGEETFACSRTHLRFQSWVARDKS